MDLKMSSGAVFSAVAAMAVMFSILVGGTKAQDASGPAPPPANDGTAIDQGIAYILMLVALLVTYFLH